MTKNPNQVNYNINLKPHQKKALEDLRFALRVDTKTELARRLLEAGLRALAAGSGTEAEAEAVSACLKEWERESDPQATR